MLVPGMGMMVGPLAVGIVGIRVVFLRVMIDMGVLDAECCC